MSNPKPLAGLRVLEFSHTIMGPCAGLLFADLGAEVVKVEPAPTGDHTRRLPGFAAGFFACFNRNKRSLALDLKRPEGQAVAHRLAAGADVVLENYGPGTMERLGCGWEQLHQVNPRLVYLALKGFLAGPYEHRPALDEVVQFQAGLAYMTGPPGRPLRAGASIIDILGAVFGVTATLAALRERDAAGKGQRVSSALFESAVFLMGSHMAGSAATGDKVPPMPARRGAWGIYDVFETAAGQLFIGVTSDQQWVRFCDAFGLAALAADPRLASNAMRAKERSWLIPALQEVLATLPQQVVAERCEAAGISWAPVGMPEDLFSDPHLLAGGGLIQTAISALGGGALVGLPALPVEFGEARSRPGLLRQPPRMGEHNAEVLAEAGFPPSEIAGLAGAGVIVAAPAA
ncbi:CaiB/BaiF CoA-transferase family protein [Siccirubricoccus sp. G192]|uniref:CaiB/BaiF CoA transferase family protein n=1 Tax=Siccirubricoccus sp. G192 TaxID=2849651 RepID=UPI001C2BBC20|nr:CaiB/BaiF CoA-transferase family protein [Siccirubricoccus sp. G192]MBV1798584.1 CoA transferase [Siccirubricoccus sp. G192]